MRCANRRYLFLQGPHGPFFAELSDQIRAEGGQVWRAGLNAGDEAEWTGDGYVPITCAPKDRDGVVTNLIKDRGITDLILYGDRRPFHAEAIRTARGLGIRCHIFEEGYLRPHWITYERNGANQRSPAASWPIERLPQDQTCELPHPEASWGALRHHILYGARYHLQLLLGRRRYPTYASHRRTSVVSEARQALFAAVSLPVAVVWRHWSQSQLLRSKVPFTVVLMQLEHDSALADSGLWADHETMLHRVMAAFASCGDKGSRLVIKLHPLECQRLRVARLARRLARSYGLSDRITCLPGGRLAPLLDRASAAVTVNSTAGQQVLWRGIPLFAFGPSVYAHEALLPNQTLEAFFRTPSAPDPTTYGRFRAFLFRTSQVPGSYYTTKGRAQTVKGILPRMLRNADPYDHEAAVTVSENHDGLIPPPASGQVAATR